MLRVYLNSPNCRATVHGGTSCKYGPTGSAPSERVIDVNADRLSTVLRSARNKEYRFAARSGQNDLWLLIDFADAEFELAVARHIKRVIGYHYTRIRDAELRVHCGPTTKMRIYSCVKR